MAARMTMASAEGFDDTMPLVSEGWATFIPSRSPVWKLHSNVGHAKNAIRSGCSDYRPVNRGAIYERQGTQWVKRVGFESHGDSDLTSAKITLYLSWIKPSPVGV